MDDTKIQENDSLGDLGSTWWDHVVAFCDARDEMLIPIGILLVAALIINIIQAWLLKRYVRRMDRSGFRWTAVIATSLSRPLGLAIWIIAISIALQMFIEPDPIKRLDSSVVIRIAQVRLGMILLLGGWFIARTIRAYERMLIEPTNGELKVDITIIRALANFLIILIWLGVLLVALQTYGVNMTAIITVGGAGSFALTFAFQDVFKNLFGGLMILFTRPFKLGEGIELAGKNIQGSVEKIGLYQTIIRGWDSVPYVIPNSMFLVTPIMNINNRIQRRINFTIGLRYEDLGKVEAIVGAIEQGLKSLEEIDLDATLRVNFMSYGASSVDINVLCFASVGLGMSEFFQLQQKILLDCGRIVSKHGADFAFPTTTLDLPTSAPVASPATP